MSDQGQVATDGQLNDQETVQNIIALRQASKDARRPRELEWTQAWNLYNNSYDFSRKAEWQSKNYIPRVNTAVRAAALIIKRGLVGPRDFFATDGIGERSKDLAPGVHKLALYHLREGDFVSRYVTALMSGLLSSLVILKVYPRWADDVEDLYDNAMMGSPTLPRRPGGPPTSLGNILAPEIVGMGPRRKKLVMRYDPVNAYDYYPDPFNEGLYKIHEMDMDLWQLKEMAAKHPYFEKDVVSAIQEDFVKVEENYRKSIHAGQDPTTMTPVEIRKRVRVAEYWGTMLDRRGNVLFKNCYAMMVNDKWMAVKPRPNPMPTKKDPFIVAPIIEKPFSVWHQGFVEAVCGLQILMTELINVAADGNLFANIKAFELDIDQVYDPTQFTSGIVPGKLYKKRGGGFNTSPMIRDIQLGNMNPQVMELFSAMDREFQGGIGLNEFLLPQQRVRAGRVTATESLQKGQNSADFFGEIARIQEEKVLEKVLEKTYEYCCHYQRDFSDPVLIEIMGKEAAAKAQLMMQNPDDKRFFLGFPFKFKASGVTQVSMRMKELEKIMSFINLVGNLAKGMPDIVKMVKIQKLLGMAIQALNWNDKELLNMPEGPEPPVPPWERPGGQPQGGGAGVQPSQVPMSQALSAPQPGNATAGMAGSPGSASSILAGG